DPELARKQLDISSQFVDTSALTKQLLPAPPSKLLESILIDQVHVALGDEVWLRSREANIKLAGSLDVKSSSRQRRGTILGVGVATGAASVTLGVAGELRAGGGSYTLPLGLVERGFTFQGGAITFFGAFELAAVPDLFGL